MHSGEGNESTAGRVMLFTGNMNNLSHPSFGATFVPVTFETVPGCVNAISSAQSSVIVNVNSSVRFCMTYYINNAADGSEGLAVLD